MHVDPLEPADPRTLLGDETTEIVYPENEAAWTPTDTLAKQRVFGPDPGLSLWTVWAAMMGALTGAATVLMAMVGALWVT